MLSRILIMSGMLMIVCSVTGCGGGEPTAADNGAPATMEEGGQAPPAKPVGGATKGPGAPADK